MTITNKRIFLLIIIEIIIIIIFNKIYNNINFLPITIILSLIFEMIFHEMIHIFSNLKNIEGIYIYFKKGILILYLKSPKNKTLPIKIELLLLVFYIMLKSPYTILFMSSLLQINIKSLDYDRN